MFILPDRQRKMDSEIEIHEIRMDTQISLPHNFVCYDTPETIVVVFPENARWIVLKENLSKDIFLLLSKGATPLKAIEDSSKSNNELSVQNAFDEVMTELIDKEIWPSMKPVSNFSIEYNMLTLTLTNACNLRCLTCYKYCESQEPFELSEIKWHQILDEFISLGGRVLRLSGGEPLFLHKELTLDLIRNASESGLKTLLLTNGTLLDKTTIKQLELSGLDRIQISLDGPDEVSNDSVRGHGVFKKVLQSIEFLRDTSLDLFVAVVPVPGISLEKLERDGKAFFNSLKNYLGRSLTVSIAQGILKGRSVDRKDDIHFVRRCRNLQDHISEYNASAGLDLWQWEPGRKNPSCGIGCSLSIEPNGDVCACAGGNVVASLKKNDLKSVIPSLRKVAIFNMVDSINECKACGLRYLCGGPCRFENVKCTEETRFEILRRIIAMNELRYEKIP